MKINHNLLIINTLITFILIAGGIPAIFFANYPMIFYKKAMFVSILAVAFSIYGLLIHAWVKGYQEPESRLRLLNGPFRRMRYPSFYAEQYAIFGLAIYSLNIYWILLTMLLMHFSGKFLLQQNDLQLEKTASDDVRSYVKNTPALSTIRIPSKMDFDSFDGTKSLAEGATFRTVIAGAFLLYDIIREYTVWHTVQLNYLPACIFLMLLVHLAYFKWK
jgi:hypothetical protein